VTYVASQHTSQHGDGEFDIIISVDGNYVVVCSPHVQDKQDK